MSSRSQRAAVAASTVEACRRGTYELEDGSTVSFIADLKAAAASTLLVSASVKIPRTTPLYGTTRIELSDEGVMDACFRLARKDNSVGCLNFASARNPGGGFLRGSLAQEEAICLVSGLYHCLLTTPAFYEVHSKARDPLYSHRVIFAARVPVLRTLEGGWLRRPYLVSFLTSAAVNARVCRTRGLKEERIRTEMSIRVERVLAIAAANGVRELVLGAWGCGVFRHNPATVAAIFARALKSSRFRGVFRRVVFAIKGRDSNYAEFAKAFRAAKMPFEEHQHQADVAPAEAVAEPPVARSAVDLEPGRLGVSKSKLELQLRAMLDSVVIACAQQAGGEWEASVAAETGEVLASETSSKRGRARRSAMKRAIEVLALREAATALRRPPEGSGPMLAHRPAPIASPQAVTSRAPPSQSFDFFAVLDFEATCWEQRSSTTPQEIIEVPVVLLDTQTLAVVAEFHRYVKPARHPTLSAFCHELTGIEQAWVDAGDDFRAVLADLEAFLVSHGLVAGAAASGGDEEPARTFAFVTCGDWDLRKMLPLQCGVSGVAVPGWARRWINVKAEATRALAPFRARGMVGMLNKLGLVLEGRHHSGIDDARNIARIVRALCVDTGTVLQLSRAGQTKQFNSATV